MRKVLIALILVTICLSTLPITVSAGEADPLLVESLFYADFPVAGSSLLEMYVNNVSGVEKTVSISIWDQYTYPDPDTQWIDPDWITSIVPESQVLAPGMKMLINVEITVPEEVMNKTFITWLRVSDGVWEKPVTVIIRTGDQIPTYAFSLESGSYYRLHVTGYGASASADTTEGKPSPIAIRSKCSATTSFMAEVEVPANTITLGSEGSSIPYDPGDNTTNPPRPSEKGITFQPVSLEDAREWVTVTNTLENPLEMGGFTTGFLPWKITIPDSLADGYYEIWLRVKPASAPAQQTIGIEYCSRLLIRVDREGVASSYGWWWYPLAIGGGLVGLIILIRRIWDRIATRKDKRFSSVMVVLCQGVLK